MWAAQAVIALKRCSAADAGKCPCTAMPVELPTLRMYGESACPRYGIQYNYRSTITYFFCLHNEKILSSIVNKRFIEIKGIIWYNQVADMKILQKDKQ